MTAIQTSDSTTERQLAFITGLEGDHYQYHIRQFANWIRDNGRELDRQTIIDYFADLNQGEYAVGTKRIKRQALKKRLRQVARYGGLGTELNSNLEQFLHDLDHETITKAPKVNSHQVGRERYLSKDEPTRVIAACRSAKQTGDVVHIRVTGKGNKERWLKISGELYGFIRDVFRGEQYLFETANGRPYHQNYISNQIAKITRRALGRSLRAHSLRHSFCTRKIREGVPIGYVSRYVGHSSLSITSDLYDHGEVETGDLVGDEL